MLDVYVCSLPVDNIYVNVMRYGPVNTMNLPIWVILNSLWRTGSFFEVANFTLQQS